MRAYVLAAAVLVQATSVSAEGFAFPFNDNYVGNSRLLTNDLIGDGKDRWRTGSYAISFTYGEDVMDGVTSDIGSLMEYRLRAEILAPEDLSQSTAFPDRPYAGVIGLGAFTHIQTESKINASFGGELVFVGPSTGLGDFQTWFHDLLNVQQPQMLDEQLPDKIYPTIQGEISKDFVFGDNETLFRPYAEAQAGIETYARVGFDTVFGNGFQKNFFTRDPNTGFLVTNKRRTKTENFGFTFGSDLAYVAHSNLLPTDRGYTVRDWRPRVRAGVVYESEHSDFFYGATWLGREFEGQRESQVIGSVRLNLRF